MVMRLAHVRGDSLVVDDVCDLVCEAAPWVHCRALPCTAVH